ncbi:MAG: class I SAM-dependent methyltransferase [Candidatus Aminicenantes bacterium]|nr:MAG: class I SAM-dependent methyltransferase [Candidatus Aminicenantes bacterium]
MNTPFKRHEVERYERRRYRGFDQRLVHGREMRILRRILHRIGPSSLPVLDIPSGYGRFSKLLKERGFSLISSDLSFHMVKRATEKHEDPAVILGVVADAKKGLPFKQDVFFLLLSMRFFHHVHEKDEREVILNKFFRVTSNWVIISYYQKNLLHILQRKLRRRVMRKKTRIKMVSRREFHEEIRGAGLKVVKVFPLFRGMHAHHIALLRKI